MKRRRLSLVLRLIPVFLVCLGCGTALAETLYQRSLPQFEARAEKASPADYTFVVMGDSRDGYDVFRKALRAARTYDPLFILHAGDYSSKGSEKETATFLDFVNREVPDIPLFVVIGNHENPGIFDLRIGPRNFVLANRNLGFKLVALNNADGALLPAEQQLLRAELEKPASTMFVAMHIPPRTDRWRGHTFTKGAPELENILRGSGVQGAFFAHAHLYDRSEFAGIPAFITGGAGAPLVWFSSYGEREYHILVVRVKDGKATYQMVPLR